MFPDCLLVSALALTDHNCLLAHTVHGQTGGHDVPVFHPHRREEQMEREWGPTAAGKPQSDTSTPPPCLKFSTASLQGLHLRAPASFSQSLHLHPLPMKHLPCPSKNGTVIAHREGEDRCSGLMKCGDHSLDGAIHRPYGPWASIRAKCTFIESPGTGIHTTYNFV